MSVCDISGSGCLVCFNKVLRLLCTIETEMFSASRKNGDVDTDGIDGIDGTADTAEFGQWL